MIDDDPSVRAARAKKGSPFLNTAQAGHYVGLSITTMEDMRRRKIGPAYRRHGRWIRYHIDDLDAWSRTSGSARVAGHDPASAPSRDGGGNA